MRYSYTWQEETIETAQLRLRVFKEAPVDGVTWQSGVSHPYVAINLNAQIQHFDVTVDSSIHYAGPVVPGDFSFVPPHTEFAGFYQGHTFSYACLTFPSVTNSPLLNSRPFVMRSDPFLKASVQALRAQRFRDDPDALLYRENLSDAIISHLQLVHLKAPPEKNLGADLDRLEQYVQENLGQKLTVSELATLLNLTPRALQRTVQRKLGKSVYDWITALRLERSLQLVRNSHLSLVEIAIQCGFANQSHWTRLFRRKFGITPGSLRR
ncbi:MAG: AraC family transcriptional regulator [Cyanobacteria bacterium P01_A01_bin.114]